MRSFLPRLLFFSTSALALMSTLHGQSQVPDTLWLSIPAPVGVSGGGDRYGATVVISGARFVVGAPFDDGATVDAGAVQVHDLMVGGGAVPILTLHAPGAAVGDQFGAALAMHGTRIVVGAPMNDTGASNAGRVFVYDLASPTPGTPVAVLPNPSPAVNDQFGAAVAISGDQVVVGAPDDDAGATNAGLAYVFDLSSGTPSAPLYTLAASGPDLFDRYGAAVSASGSRVAVVAAYRDQLGYPDLGEVYVYDLASSTPLTPVKLLSSYANLPGGSQSNIGGPVAISGSQVVTSAHPTGTELVFRFNVTQFTQPAPLTSPNGPSFTEEFGSAVAIAGGIAIVGERGLGYTSHVGKAFVYPPAAPRVNLTNPSPHAGDQFGAAVGIDSGISVIGAPFDDTTAPDQGAVHVFGPLDGDADGLRDYWEVTQFGTAAGHSALDDGDKDGYPELPELALGLSPTVPNAGGLPGVTSEGGYLTMTMTKQPGVTYEVQTSGTLAPGSFSAATTVVLVNDLPTLKVRDQVLLGAPGGRFIRVQVTAAP